MPDDIIISVEHLSKRYRLGQIGATTLRESVGALVALAGHASRRRLLSPDLLHIYIAG